MEPARAFLGDGTELAVGETQRQCGQPVIIARDPRT